MFGLDQPAFPVADILQERAHAGKTGRVLFNGPQQQVGEISLLQGRILHAKIGDHRGESALYCILKWGACQWKWLDGETTPETSIFQPVETLLMNFAFVSELSEQELKFHFAAESLAACATGHSLNIVVRGGEISGFRVALDQRCLMIGRDSFLCNFVISDASISSRHGMLIRNGNAVRYEDLGSTNGSWKDGELVTEVDLKVGDVINLASVSIILVDFGEIDHPREKTNLDLLKTYQGYPLVHLEPLGSDLKPVQHDRPMHETTKLERLPSAHLEPTR